MRARTTIAFGILAATLAAAACTTPQRPEPELARGGDAEPSRLAPPAGAGDPEEAYAAPVDDVAPAPIERGPGAAPVDEPRGAASESSDGYPATRSPAPAAAPRAAMKSADSAESSYGGGLAASGAATSGPSAMGGYAPRGASPAYRPSPAPARPGLGTEWGESRSSHVSTAPFERADGAPFAIASLFYNDRAGARAMAGMDGYRPLAAGSVNVAGDGLTVALRDESGSSLPGFYAGDRAYAIGEAGHRYTIVVTNHTPRRVEAVASVDGLDVLDGRSADFAKRGYVVAPWGTLEIDGFRRSEDDVAAFRFGSVRDSYAARKGSDRNVGVVGVAFFAQRVPRPWPWTREELERRSGAEPFPGRFAAPPP